MPRFAILLKSSPTTEAGILPTGDLLKSMMTYNESLVKSGVMLTGEGLQASSKGARVIFNDPPEVISGPFTPAEHLISGFWFFKTETQEEAIEWVKKCPGLGKGTIIEVRKLLEQSDFGEVFPVELEEKANKLREQITGRSGAV
ncbi:hypothetical protein PILCRDRAFT_809876 [Piloderma croceum F 1598]|uniref:YCII-related domain-containing protein n=1 Tax=Piloderma croceum (strain F 1598) TaxID=765440 RepID=A0A0C3GJS1_PILCF|nr:hypothetical protein PILCRDRAFT_809876 [Piloderma croceum F 1598]